jgi:hypothetical protein
MPVADLSQQRVDGLLARIGLKTSGSSETFNARLAELGYETRAIPCTLIGPTLNRLHDEMHQRGVVTEEDCEACSNIGTLEV